MRRADPRPPAEPTRKTLRNQPVLHAERASVDIQQRLLLLDFGRLLAADADQLPDHLGLGARALGLGIDVLDVAGKRLALRPGAIS